MPAFPPGLELACQREQPAGGAVSVKMLWNDRKLAPKLTCVDGPVFGDCLMTHARTLTFLHFSDLRYPRAWWKKKVRTNKDLPLVSVLQKSPKDTPTTCPHLLI